MATYIVIKDILNFRDRPSLADEHFIGEAKLGEALELSEQAIPGETPAGTDDDHWLVDNRNRFVSRAGVALMGTYAAKKAVFLADLFNRPFIDMNDKENEAKWKVSWGHVDLEIWRIWKEFKTKGENVKVAVIDTGVWTKDNDLKGKVNIESSFNFPGSDFILDDTDPSFHGTKSAGIIAANGSNAHTVIGIAPACELIVYKVMSNIDGGGFVESNMVTAFKSARDAGADIISVSIELFDKPSNLDEEVAKCFLEKNILMFSAMGDENGEAIRFPAACENVVAVGAYTLQEEKRVIFSQFSAQGSHLKFLAPGENILTTGKTEEKSLHHATSASTPFAAGIFALAVSLLKKNNKKVDAATICKNFQKFCTKINHGTDKDNHEGFGVLSPGSLLAFIKDNF